MRLRNIKNSEEKILASEMIIKNFPVEINHNFILEMGMGKGEMLSEMALQNPDKTFIGIEKYPTVALKSLNKAKQNNLNNFFVINKDINKLPELLKGKTDLIWLTFSDPWPKKRHYKRRLTYKSFLDIYKELLSEDGVIKLKTDNDGFFDFSIQSMVEYGMKIQNLTRDFHKSDLAKNNIMTGYEIKWSSQNKNINYLEAKFEYKKAEKL